MLHYTLIFLIVALLAGFLGFGVIAGTAASIAKILFIIFLAPVFAWNHDQVMAAGGRGIARHLGVRLLAYEGATLGS